MRRFLRDVRDRHKAFPEPRRFHQRCSPPILPWSDWNSGIRAGDDGRFRVEGLVPGLRYSANSRTGFEAFGDLFKDVIVAPGESKDLGDLKVQPPKKQED